MCSTTPIRCNIGIDVWNDLCVKLFPISFIGTAHYSGGDIVIKDAILMILESCSE